MLSTLKLITLFIKYLEVAKTTLPPFLMVLAKMVNTAFPAVE